eukprot:1158097-Pelagomonas_calceolata.AAC.1
MRGPPLVLQCKDAIKYDNEALVGYANEKSCSPPGQRSYPVVAGVVADRKSDATFAASYNLFKLPLGLTLMNASGLSEEFKKSNISCPLLRWCSRCTSSGGGSFCMWHMRASAAVYRFWGWSYFNL